LLHLLLLLLLCRLPPFLLVDADAAACDAAAVWLMVLLLLLPLPSLSLPWLRSRLDEGLLDGRRLERPGRRQLLAAREDAQEDGVPEPQTTGTR
jgi:hypothetical protein